MCTVRGRTCLVVSGCATNRISCGAAVPLASEEFYDACDELGLVDPQLSTWG